MEYNMEDKKRKKIILFAGIIAMVLLLIGSAYAFFTYSKNHKAFVLSSEGVELVFTKGTNRITFSNAYPISDEFAIDNLDKLDYVDFTLKGKANYEDEPIYYEIYLTEGKNNTLNSSNIRVYLTDDKNNKVAGPFNYSDMPTSEAPLVTNGKIIENNTKLDFNKNYRIYAWISKDYTQNEVSQQFSFYVNLYSTNKEVTLSDNLIERIKDKAYYGDKEVIAINKSGDKCENLESCAGNIREYRYSGPEVNNYIYLKDNDNVNELWRIIGIFTDEDSREEYIRVIRDELLPESYLPTTYKANSQTYKIKGSSNYAYWNNLTGTSSDKNNWSTAGLQYYLNGEQDEDGTKGYLYYLSSGTKELLKEDVKYYLGSVKYSEDNAKTAYEHERDVESCVSGKGNVSSSSNFPNAGCNVWDGNDTTWTGTVGLMYPSDYGYSASSDNWDKVFYNSSTGSFYQSEINATSWMYSTMTDAKSKFSWAISPSSSSSSYAVNWYPAGGLDGRNVYNNSLGARAVLNLKSETTWLSGEGTKENPYKVVIEDQEYNMIEKIKDKAYSEVKEVIAINKSGDKCNSLGNCDVREYRYSGSEVNNYIYLKNNQEQDEKWRIIGIFTDEDTKEEYIKVIRDELLPESYLPTTYKVNSQTYKIKGSSNYAYWNNLTGTSSDKNNWSTAGLQYYLNSEQDEDGTKGYLSYLSEKTKKLLKKDVKYYLGSIISNTDNVKTAYGHERDVGSCENNKGGTTSNSSGCYVWDGNAATWTGTVGLMYPSDYGYSASSDYWTKELYNYDNSTLKTTNWMYSGMTDAKNKNSWAISPTSNDSTSAIYWTTSGYSSRGTIYSTSYAVRPVLNLRSEIIGIRGKGTSDSPYVVIWD